MPGLNTIPNIPFARTLYVDPTFGTATGGTRGYQNRPYSTYALALDAWTPGDTIHMRPGVYTAAMAMPSYTRTIAAAGSSGLVRASNVVTCTVTAAHAIPVGTLVYVSGATNSAFDGVFRVVSAPTTTTLTWFQYGSDATSGGGSLTAAGYIHMDPGVVVDVTHASVSAAVATLGGSTNKTYTIVAGDGELRSKNGYCVSLNAADSRLEISCREITSYGSAAQCPALFVNGLRSTCVADIAHRIYSERYDGVWINAGKAYVSSRIIDAGDNAIELVTATGCHIEAEEIVSYTDRWFRSGDGIPGGAIYAAFPGAGETHYIKAGTVRTVGSTDELGTVAGINVNPFGASNGGRIYYDVRKTLCAGGPAVWMEGDAGDFHAVNARIESSYTGAAAGGENTAGGYAITFISGTVYLEGDCELVASSAETYIIYADVARTLRGRCRVNKTGHTGIEFATDAVDFADAIVHDASFSSTAASKGVCCIVPRDCFLIKWQLIGDVSGSAVVDIKRAGTSIVGASGTKPTLSSAASAIGFPVSWTDNSLEAGDLLEYVVSGPATLTNLRLRLWFLPRIS